MSQSPPVSYPLIREDESIPETSQLAMLANQGFLDLTEMTTAAKAIGLNKVVLEDPPIGTTVYSAQICDVTLFFYERDSPQLSGLTFSSSDGSLSLERCYTKALIFSGALGEIGDGPIASERALAAAKERLAQLLPKSEPPADDWGWDI